MSNMDKLKKLVDQSSLKDDKPFWWKDAEATPLSESPHLFREFCNRKGYTDEDLQQIFK